MIPFNRPWFADAEVEMLSQALRGGHTSGNGPFTARAEAQLEQIQGHGRSLLTTSCTHALEMSARLLDLQPGDEVIVPSYTFVSTASAFLWNGARPVFADVRADTLTMDPESAESLINDRTRAICIVHYAGVGADPEVFAAMAERHGLMLIEDNAHGLGGTYQCQRLGTFGALSTLSFHETKNITCGEGGALVVNAAALIDRAEILREKGTDRSKFVRGQVDKYTWVDSGSSWVLSDLLAGILVAQLDRFPQIDQERRRIWQVYHDALQDWSGTNSVIQPHIPNGAEHTGHMYYLRLADRASRDRFISHMKERGVMTVFHYQSLHSSPMGQRLGEQARWCPNSDAASDGLVRLPLFVGLSESDQARIIQAIVEFRP